MKRFAIAGATALSVLVAGVAAAAQSGGAATQTVAPPTKMTICHKTGSQSNPWRRITVSSRALANPKSQSGKTLRGHLGHTGDAVVVGTAACPAASLTPAPSSTKPTKITICHKTGSTSNPYRRITVSSRAVTNPNSPAGKVLRGHAGHTGDILAPGTAACPSGTGSGSQALKLSAALQAVQGATGSGNATFRLNLRQGRLCYTLTVTGLTSVNAAHIHRGSTQAVVVPLTAPTTGSSSGCVDVAKDLLTEIAQNPGAFYVNVHTASYPNGQVQGTLAK